VVALREVIEAEGEYLLVLDYVEGISLATLLGVLSARGERLPLRVTARVVIDALRGLHAAHELLGEDGMPIGLVHRDATPHNILLGADGRVRLTDFGIARAAARAVRTDPGFAKGKFAYMAPEHAFAEPIDRRADVFSMGVVAWEALVCRRLWERRSIREIARGVALGDIAAPSSAGAACAPAVDRAVLRALAPWRDQRWPTAAAFADALYAAALEGGGVAGAAEVADAVDDACGAQLAERRARLAALTSTRPAAPATPTRAPDREAHTERPGALGRPRVATPLSTSVDVPRAELATLVDGGASRRRLAQVAPLLAAAAVTAALGGLWIGREKLAGGGGVTLDPLARAGVAAHVARVAPPTRATPTATPSLPQR
jgi:eukaryotic-like serine/threonine-protein kinase